MERDTVGKLSSELLQQDISSDHSVGEQMREQLSEFESNFFDCVTRGKNSFTDDFYVVVITKRERLMPNVIRNYFFPRLSCPTPDYDQAVYLYNRKDDNVEFLWVIPSKQAAIEIKQDMLILDSSHHELLRFVLDFFDGTLDARARAYNDEVPIKKEPIV
jgi:hypothetical protein